MKRVTRLGLRGTALVGVLALFLSACGAASGDEVAGTDATAEGDEISESGADIDVDAIDEVEITVQIFYGPENLYAVAFQEYADAVEQVSNGKITFDLHYAGALVDLPEIEDALQSGLIDLAMHIPIYNPETFPVSNVTSDLAFLSEQSPVLGTLQGLGANMQFGLEAEPHVDEMRSHGLVPVLPLTAATPNFHLLCADDPVTSLDEAAGKRARVSGPGYASTVEALGMSPVDLVGGEIYEGLQRGIVDCVVGHLGDARDMGLLELGDHWTVDPEVAFTGWSASHLAFSELTWDSLSVDAQRILWDEAGDTFLRTFLPLVLEDSADAIVQGMDEGIEFHEWEPDARQGLEDHFDSVLEEAPERAGEHMEDGEAYVQRLVDAYDEWLDIVRDLGYSDDEHSSWMEFAEVNPSGDIDTDPFVDYFINEVHLPHRP